MEPEYETFKRSMIDDGCHQGYAKERDQNFFMDVDELCRLYVKTNQITFGTSTLEPGKKGGTDPGHKNGEEIFYVAKGKVICSFPKKRGQKRVE